MTQEQRQAVERVAEIIEWFDCPHSPSENDPRFDEDDIRHILAALSQAEAERDSMRRDLDMALSDRAAVYERVLAAEARATAAEARNKELAEALGGLLADYVPEGRRVYASDLNAKRARAALTKKGRADG